MNRYGQLARRHWERWLPGQYAAIQDPDGFFTALGRRPPARSMTWPRSSPGTTGRARDTWSGPGALPRPAPGRRRSCCRSGCFRRRRRSASCMPKASATVPVCGRTGGDDGQGVRLVPDAEAALLQDDDAGEYLSATCRKPSSRWPFGTVTTIRGRTGSSRRTVKRSAISAAMRASPSPALITHTTGRPSGSASTTKRPHAASWARSQRYRIRLSKPGVSKPAE